MTFSLLGRCPRSQRFGAVVSSSSPAVGARCIFVRSRIGAAATQNLTDPSLGPALLDQLSAGARAELALARVAAAARHVEHRQLAVLDSHGTGATRTGALTLACHGHRIGANAVAAGNLLAHKGVVTAMVEQFEGTSDDDLGQRLIAALQAGLDAGGEIGPVRSAALLIAGDVSWPLADLRVDWHQRPVSELARLWDVWEPQLQHYLTRALNPEQAPSYGIPGA